VRELLLIRHGVTAWNRAGRVQGRRDVPLDAAARSELATRRVPAPWRDGEWHASPLVRALDTARALGGEAVRTHPALAEMDWGDWEGRRLAELRAALGESMARNEARGLDFRPPGGESPRAVRARLAGWLADRDATGPPLVVVTHKGVLRAALSLATGWDQRAPFRPRPDWRCGHAFVLGPGARLRLARLDVALEPRR